MGPVGWTAATGGGATGFAPFSVSQPATRAIARKAGITLNRAAARGSHENEEADGIIKAGFRCGEWGRAGGA
jgi:hypothetical protein